MNAAAQTLAPPMNVVAERCTGRWEPQRSSVPWALTAGPAAFPASLWALLLHRRLQLARAVFKQTAAVVAAVVKAVQWRIDGLPPPCTVG